MEWYKRSIPKLGTTRWILKFAWLPTRVGKRTTVWLGKYVVHQIFTDWKVPGPGMKGTRTIFNWKTLAKYPWAGKGIAYIVNR